MTREEFRERVKQGVLFLDGATGSNLRAMGMPVGVSTEEWVLEHPDVLEGLQRRYVEAGSNVILAPTFTANRIGLSMYGLENKLEQMNRDAVALSRRAADGKAMVAADMTTTGKRVDDPDGITYSELMDAYSEQASVLADAGVDLFVVETMLGVTECSAAIEAIRSVCDLPIICTMTLDSIGGAYFDGDAESAAEQLPALGADAFGVNCGQGPELYEGLIRRLSGVCDVPIVAKPNAGMPVMQPDGSAYYAMTPGKFAREMQKLYAAGARILGGCCGTTPEHIAMLTQFVK